MVERTENAGKDDVQIQLDMSSPELHRMIKLALADKDYHVVAAAALELLRRDIDDYEAHSALLQVFNQLGFNNELVDKSSAEFKSLILRLE